MNHRDRTFKTRVKRALEPIIVNISADGLIARFNKDALVSLRVINRDLMESNLCFETLDSTDSSIGSVYKACP